MSKKIRLSVGIVVASVAIALIVLFYREYVHSRQTLSSDGPLYIKSLSLGESQARLDLTGAKPIILFPPRNWDKVAAVVRQLCLDVGGAKVVQPRSRHRGPPLGFILHGIAIVNGRSYTLGEFRFDFHDLNDRFIKLTVVVNPRSAYPEKSPKHSEEYLIKELARRIGISGARELKGSCRNY